MKRNQGTPTVMTKTHVHPRGDIGKDVPPVTFALDIQTENDCLVMDVDAGVGLNKHASVYFLSTDHETRRLLREQFQTMLDHPLLAPLAVAEDGGKTDE